MAQPAKPASGASRSEPSHPALLCGVGWLVPGAGHFMLGQTRKALVFFVLLTAMYVIGLAVGGRLFPFESGEPLVFLAALAEWAAALPRLAAMVGGFGQGQVTAATYEYGNTFIIASGLLNTLVMLDIYDRATGRKL
jgi:hypothetical protein